MYISNDLAYNVTDIQVKLFSKSGMVPQSKPLLFTIVIFKFLSLNDTFVKHLCLTQHQFTKYIVIDMSV